VFEETTSIESVANRLLFVVVVVVVVFVSRWKKTTGDFDGMVRLGRLSGAYYIPRHVRILYDLQFRQCALCRVDGCTDGGNLFHSAVKDYLVAVVVLNRHYHAWFTFFCEAFKNMEPT